MVAAIPAGNLAARTIQKARAGFVVEPSDQAGFIVRLDRLLDSPSLREEMGGNGRAYAEETFDIAKIAGRFLEIAACSPKQSR